MYQKPHWTGHFKGWTSWHMNYISVFKKGAGHSHWMPPSFQKAIWGNILGWPKSLLGFFRKMLRKNPSDPFGQPNILKVLQMWEAKEKEELRRCGNGKAANQSINHVSHWDGPLYIKPNTKGPLPCPESNKKVILYPSTSLESGHGCVICLPELTTDLPGRKMMIAGHWAGSFSGSADLSHGSAGYAF